MLNEQTLNQLRALHLDGMVAALSDAATHITASELPFEQRLALLVQREMDWRDSKRLDRLLKAARLKVSSACLEDIDWRASRGLSREVITSLAGGDWLRHGHNMLLTGATGCGKTWLACALGQQAARLGFSVLYTRVPRLLQELHVAHGDGSLAKRLAQLARLDSRRYLFVAIDRATRWVFVQIKKNETAASAKAFLNAVHKACPMRIQKVLTDNGKEFTDRLFASRARQPTGEHEFDQLCASLGIEHRLTKPRCQRRVKFPHFGRSKFPHPWLVG